MRKQWKCTHRAVRRKQCRNPIVLIRLTEPITNTAGAFSQHFQVIFSQCDTHCFHASFISDSFFPVQSILFMDLISGTIPLKSLPFPSVFSSSCSRAGQMENQIINNDRCKKIRIFIMLQFGAPNEAGNRHKIGAASSLAGESKHCCLWQMPCFIKPSNYNLVLKTHTFHLNVFLLFCHLRATEHSMNQGWTDRLESPRSPPYALGRPTSNSLLTCWEGLGTMKLVPSCTPWCSWDTRALWKRGWTAHKWNMLQPVWWTGEFL